MTSTPELSEHAAEPPRCYRCETEMGEEERVCPSCGRLQFRVCHCAKQLRIALDTCPHCGADWSHSARTRRARRKRSASGSPKELARYFAVGAVTFVLVAGSLYYAGGRVAERLLDADAPASPFERLWYLWRALVLSIQHIVMNVSGVKDSPHALLALEMAAIGGAVGILAYLLRYRLRWLRRLMSPKHGRGRRAA